MVKASAPKRLHICIHMLLLECISRYAFAVTNVKSTLQCKSQGPLKLQEGRLPAPTRLPFCQQYSDCTCCERRHAQAFGLRIQSSLEASSLSQGCRDMTAKLACRLCDPEVGMGLKATVCEDTCKAWLGECGNDFFEYHPLSEELMPCSDNSLVCSHLRELALDGADLCKKAGLTMEGSGSGGMCFDGSVPPLLAACKPKPRPRPDKWKALIVKAQPFLLMLMMSAVCGGIILLFFSARRMQPAAVASTEQPAELAPAKAAGIAAMEREDRRQS